MAHFHSPRIITDGLVLALDAANTKSYPGSGTTWSDLSGNGNNGTLTNGPTFDSGNLGSLEFDGTDDTAQYSVSGFSPTSNFTFEIIFKIKVFAEGLFLGAGHAAGGPYGWEIRQTQNGLIRFGSRPASGGSTRTVTFSPSANTIHHGFGVHNGTSGTILMYINRNFIGSTTIDQTAGGYSGGTIGTQSGRRIGGSGASAIPFNGNIYNIKIYNRALTPEEILQNYNATNGRYGL